MIMEKEGEGGPVVRWERAENHGVWRPREKKIESDSLNHQKHRLKLPNHLHSWSWLSPSPPSSSLPLSLSFDINFSLCYRWKQLFPPSFQRLYSSRTIFLPASLHTMHPITLFSHIMIASLYAFPWSHHPFIQHHPRGLSSLY